MRDLGFHTHSYRPPVWEPSPGPQAPRGNGACPLNDDSASPAAVARTLDLGRCGGQSQQSPCAGLSNGDPADTCIARAGKTTALEN